MITEIECKQLNIKLKDTFKIFDSLPLDKSYQLNFSGGKDSHALLISYLLWQKYREKTLDVVVSFSDTYLEEDSLYVVIENIESFLSGQIPFTRKLPEHSYWYYQFGLGFPVPNHRNRWCTQHLKVRPLGHDRINLTGRHFGESIKRDQRLSCSSGECGVDMIKDSYDPIVHFRDCDVWDLIFYADGTILYEGVFDLLKSTYNQNTKETGSLRMGCIMCPVVGMNNLINNNSEPNIQLREILEELRECDRIRTSRSIVIKPPNKIDELLCGNPNKILKKDSFNKTQLRYIYSCLLVTLFLKQLIKFGFHFLRFNPLGAIHIKERFRIWEKIDKEYLLEKNYLTEKELNLIESMLKLKTYPKTYSNKWINYEHKRLLWNK